MKKDDIFSSLSKENGSNDVDKKIENYSSFIYFATTRIQYLKNKMEQRKVNYQKHLHLLFSGLRFSSLYNLLLGLFSVFSFDSVLFTQLVLSSAFLVPFFIVYEFHSLKMELYLKEIRFQVEFLQNCNTILEALLKEKEKKENNSLTEDKTISKYDYCYQPNCHNYSFDTYDNLNRSYLKIRRR